MRLPKFEYLRPESLEKTVNLLAEHGEQAKILAGGTDLLVRMKKGLLAPGVLISLRDLKELSYIEEKNGSLYIGAGTPLAAITGSNRVKKEATALFTACEKIGAATIQHYRGTIGGNVLQENRCHHYNQSKFHRSGRQPCHKDGGKTCYARDNADRCYSTCQSDGATALMALDAKLVLISKSGERMVTMADFYTNDGMHPFDMEPGELLREIIVPEEMTASAYQRLSYRSAVDYPVVCAGAALKATKGVVDKARIAVGAIGRSPLYLAQASAALKGKSLTDEGALRAVAVDAMESAAAFAVHNVGATLEYRCEMIEPMVLRALTAAAGTILGESAKHGATKA